jgi:hypothetical protein
VTVKNFTDNLTIHENAHRFDSECNLFPAGLRHSQNEYLPFPSIRHLHELNSREVLEASEMVAGKLPTQLTDPWTQAANFLLLERGD